MAAPPPPPPPPPPGPINASKPDNKKLLDSICKGAILKKVPDSEKMDRSEVALNKPQGIGNSKNNTGPLVPPSGKTMTLAEELAARRQKSTASPTIPPSNKPLTLKDEKANIPQIAPPAPLLLPSKKPMTLNEEIAGRKNQKPTDLQPVPQIITNAKKTNAPSPNSVPQPKPPPPPPSAHNKPPSIAQPPALTQPPITLPPPPVQSNISTGQPPPPPPPTHTKPNFRKPIPICSKPTQNNDSQIRGNQTNQFCGPIIPPPPPMLPPTKDIHPPRFGPPPPPPPSTMPIQVFKPDTPIRVDSRGDFDSRFNFMDMKDFPDPSTMNKIRQT